MSDSLIRQLERDSIHGDKLDLIKYLTAVERVGQLTRDQKILRYLLDKIENDNSQKAILLKAAKFGWPPAIKIANLLSLVIPKSVKFESEHIKSLSPSNGVNLVCDYIEKLMYLFEWQLNSDVPKNALNAARQWCTDPSERNSRLAYDAGDESVNIGDGVDDQQASCVALAAGYIALSVSLEPYTYSDYNVNEYPDFSYLELSRQMSINASLNILLEKQYQMEKFCEYLTGTNNIL